MHVSDAAVSRVLMAVEQVSYAVPLYGGRVDCGGLLAENQVPAQLPPPSDQVSLAFDAFSDHLLQSGSSLYCCPIVRCQHCSICCIHVLLSLPIVM